MSIEAATAVSPLHVFDNGVKVYRRHLIPLQIARYASGENLHEPEEERLFLDLIRESDLAGRFLDVGAAIGYYSLLAHRVAPSLKIHAFEPYGVHRTYLSENLELNRVNKHAIKVHPEAVGATTGVSEFHIEHYGSSLVAGTARKATIPFIARRMFSRLMPNSAEIGKSNSTVSLTTLDGFTARHGAAELVKVDVQGFEVDVLRGAAKAMEAGAIRRWLIGTHGEEIHRECAALLEAKGYRITFNSPVVAGQPDGVIVAKAA